MDTVRMTVEEMRRLCVGTLRQVGVRGEVAEVVAGHLVDAEVTGHASHGLLQLPSLVRDIRGGRLDAGAEPVIESAGSQLLVDGRKALAHWVLPMVVERAIDMAQHSGVCLALIRNLRSTGRLGAYVERAARVGMAALLVTGSLGDPHDALVAAFGGRARVLGTNPIAFAAPTGATPLVIDLSTAATTMGQIRRSRVLGDDLSSPGVVDGAGGTTREVSAFYAGGAIAPAAGHKGYALALMVAALAALSGGHDNDGRIGGSFLLVARPVSADYPADLRVALDRVGSDSTAVRVPGAGHDEARRHACEAGVALSAAVLQEVNRAWEGVGRSG